MVADGADLADNRGARRAARLIVGVLGALGALRALTAFPLPWYTLKNGPTFTGLDLLRVNQLAYTVGYYAGYTPDANDPPVCMSGVVKGIGLPIGLTLAMCVALLLVALAAIWRAPRGWWGQAGMLVWVVGGWMALFFLFPWITALVNIDSLRSSTSILCDSPGVSDSGQTVLQSGLALMCAAGLVYGLLFGPSASRLAQVGAITGIAAYLMPSSLSPLSFAGIPIGPEPSQSYFDLRPCGSVLLIPLCLFVVLAISRTDRREGTPEAPHWLAGVCLGGALLGALLTAFAAAVQYFGSGILIIGPGINLMFLSDVLLFVAGVRSMARGGTEARSPRLGKRERDALFWQARLGGKEPWPLP